MMNTAKNTIRLTICVLAGLVLGGCFSQWKGDNAAITIYLGGGANRAAYTPDDETLSRLIYVVNLSGPSPFTAGPTAPGAKSVSISLYPGSWTITVTAYLDGPDGLVYARGSETIEARAGQSASISIKLRFVGEHTVTFDTGEGSSEVPSQKVINGGTANRPDNPTRDSFGFVRWYSDVETEAEYDFENTPVLSDIILYAKWSKTKHNVIFLIINDTGGPYKTEPVGDGGTITRPANPTRTGYVFDGWYSDEGCGKAYVFNTQIYNDTRLYARWIPQFTVTFNSNGGSSVAPQTVTQGEKAERPDNPTRDNYGFVCWYIETPDDAYNFNTSVTTDLTLYAQWNATTFTVTFNGNGGIPATSAATVGAGGTATPPDPSPKRDGYALEGWYRNEDLSVKYNFDNPVTANITLYAKWILQFTVTFNSNNGSAVTPQTVAQGETAARPADPTRAGSVFEGWYTSQSFTGEYKFDAPVTANITLYAKWNAIINIADIKGVAVPVTGGTPVKNITQTAQYTGTVTWNGNPSAFAPETVYTATITLTAKNGYTLQGVAANFFTVAGATLSSNSANSGVVTAVFPATLPFVVEMVHVPSGSFQMGEPNTNFTESDKSRPVHTVTLTKGFYLGKYPVTQEQYQTVMGTNPSYFNGSTGREPASGEVQGKRPVENVSWYEAIVFCNKLSKAEGLTPAYLLSDNTDPVDFGTVPTSSNEKWDKIYIVAGSNGYRLPTEAQWEYAAKGGNGSPGNYTYSGSNTLNSVAWYLDNSDGKTHEVGKKASNGLGLYDMSGNVWDWCWDWYGAYSSEAQTDPTGPSTATEEFKVRVAHGGCWNNEAQHMYTALRLRNQDYPYKGSWGIGFRLVRPN